MMLIIQNEEKENDLQIHALTFCNTDDVNLYFQDQDKS